MTLIKLNDFSFRAQKYSTLIQWLLVERKQHATCWHIFADMKWTVNIYKCFYCFTHETNIVSVCPQYKGFTLRSFVATLLENLINWSFWKGLNWDAYMFWISNNLMFFVFLIIRAGNITGSVKLHLIIPFLNFSLVLKKAVCKVQHVLHSTKQ